MREFDAEVIDVGFISDAQDGAEAAEKLRAAGCDLIVGFLTTYMTASMLVPVARRADAPVLLINLQPTPSMDHASFDTGQWLAYCGACPLPEMANAFERVGVPFRSVSGYLEDERAWQRIGRWIRAAGVRSVLRDGRHGLMGHLYPGMYDVSTDLTMVTGNLGGHMEVLEFDDLRVRVEQVGDRELAAKLDETRAVFELADSVVEEDLRWAAKVAVGLDRLVADFDLDSLAYYHRGLDAEVHERLGAGMILGSSLLTARGVPACGEYELRTSLAMLIADRLGAGARSPNSRRSTSPRGWSRWATTARGIWRSASTSRCCAGWGCTTGSAAGASRWNSTYGTGRSPSWVSGRRGTAATGWSRPRARWCQDRCWRSATPLPGSTSVAIRASGPTRGARAVSVTTGPWRPANCSRTCGVWPG